ncbi:signal peptidase I [Pseudoxanthomonas dokdonensis]|uniref:Signal peptidase I n=1 Tax=Pseudoxanthomonas dokdonensis TaxID=344882 RepID=A0A0R0CZS8_9GAMM|nr:signal peptidase I [Pseudoxanthomonas dokdonensis]KRG70867.1 signal peptidase [Pseudoxanthomonas dokdonensis]
MVWFETILVVLTLLTGVIWLLDKLFFAKRRAARDGLLDEEPVLVDYSRAFFPVLALVLVLRSFVAEPYKIPSSSMMPNLLIGDFILVNKFAYGLRLPINNQKFIAVGEPKRGDVVVFKPPFDPNNNWIKRIIGLPGDRITFQGNTVYINGQALAYQTLGTYSGRGLPYGVDQASELEEQLPGRPHKVLEALDRFSGEGEWVVPAGHYFVMGDNRDNSEDSRLWPTTHFLPEENLRGKAFLIWLNCEGWFCKDGFDASRIGHGIQ